MQALHQSDPNYQNWNVEYLQKDVCVSECGRNGAV